LEEVLAITSSRQKFHPADTCLAVVAVVTGFFFVSWILDLGEFDLFSVTVSVWNALPYIGITIISLFGTSNWVSRAVLILGYILVTGFGLLAFDSINKDAQGPLILLFAPFYMSAVVLLLAIIIGVIEWNAGRWTRLDQP
jgi:hypothetical protein